MDISDCKFCILGIVDTNYSCSFILSGVSSGYHIITIQALLDEIVYGEIIERFFVFTSMWFIYVLVHTFFALLPDPTIKFKESSYEIKEDNEMFMVTVQKFGLTTESVMVSIRTRASNPTSATRMYIIIYII